MQKYEKKLHSLIRAKKAKIAVIGLGYVGLPLAHAFAQEGYSVFGIDRDPSKIQSIKFGRSYIGDLKSQDLKQAVRAGRLKATHDEKVLRQADVIIVCVPTPLNRYKNPDVSYIVSAAEAIAAHLHSGQLIILESTTYPGTTDEVILPTFEKNGLRVGKDFFLCFSPERIDPANPKFKTRDIPKVVGGVTLTCGKMAKELYSKIMPEVILVSSARTAEMTKLLENTFRIVNIGLINELARAAAGLKVNIWEAVDAAKTKPFGFMPFYPGPGIGGHCIGIDPIFLSWKSKLLGTELHFIELARRINAEMPRFIVSQAVYQLNQFKSKAVHHAKILILGVSYKKNVDDVRESPALEIIAELQSLGASISYHDPHVKQLKNETIHLHSVPLSQATLSKQDLVIIVSDHDAVDYQSVVRNSRLIFDTRNVLKRFPQKHIVRL